MARNVTAEHVKEIFGRYGAVKSVDLALDKARNVAKVIQDVVESVAGFWNACWCSRSRGPWLFPVQGSAQVSMATHKDAEEAQLHLDGVREWCDRWSNGASMASAALRCACV